MIKKYLIILTAVCSILVSSVYAATPGQQLCEGAGGTWNGKNSSCTQVENKAGTVQDMIKVIVNIFLLITAALSVVMIVIGGFRYTVSGGDQAAVKNAKNTILYATIGLIISIMAYAVVSFVGNYFLK